MGNEMAVIVNLAATGGEATREKIERGCKRAHYLLWIEKEGAPCSVAAVKDPGARAEDK